MDEDEFWAVIARLGGVATEEAVEGMVSILAARGEVALREFDDHLGWALRSLDTPGHAQQLVADVSEPADAGLTPMSSDVFLFARCAVVASGRSVWERVLDHPEALSGVWELAESEALTMVTARVADLLGWEDYEPPDYDAGISSVPSSDADDWWFTSSSGTGIGVNLPEAYSATIYMLDSCLRQSAAWRQWWEAAELPKIVCYQVYVHPAREVERAFFFGKDVPVGVRRIRKKKKEVEVEIERDLAVYEGVADDELRQLAKDDMVECLELVRVKFGLKPYPSLPTV